MMTNEQIDSRLRALSENQIVQGELLARVELLVERNAQAIGRCFEAIERLGGRVTVMESAMERLFEHMDRFIRGLESNGHKT